MTENSTARLRPGDWVRVRTVEEIAATLDDRGQLDGLPMMPEMLAFVGRRCRVASRAEAACATDQVTAIRRLRNVVHLEGLRCNGVDHGQCQSGCLIFWHEAWLESVDATLSQVRSAEAATSDLLPLLQLATQDSPAGEQRRFRCQATQLWQASEKLPVWNPSQYLRQITANGVAVGRVATSVLATLAQKIGQRLRGRPTHVAEGHRTPVRRLGLTVGELVEVRPLAEIEPTLDKHGNNRGLWFDPQMANYCGRKFRVAQSIERMIDEGSGRLIELKTPTVTLESVVCDGCWHRFCSREARLFWRETWLKRVTNPAQESDSPSPHISPATVGSLGSAPAPAAVRD
ncbi:MAG: hypothetical protein AAGD11_08130 [Planctomycetota bacterium]